MSLIFSKKITISSKYLLLGIITWILPIIKVHAVCPVCTLVVGAGVGLARWCSIDDSITGLWIGGLIVSLIIWTIDWLNRHKIRFYGRKILVTIFYYAIVIIPLYSMKIMGNPDNKLFSLDKLLLGIICGTIAFSIAAIYYQRLKKKNFGRAYFPGQKVVMPISALLFLSALFYFIT